MLEQMVKSSLPAFRFIIQVNDVAYGAFTECTLPLIEWEAESVKEGGLNNYTHQLPGRRKPATVTLKNGVGASALMQWYLDVLRAEFERRTVTVTLLDSTKASVMVWQIADAYPLKWSGPQLRSGENSIAIQSVELACGAIDVIPGG